MEQETLHQIEQIIGHQFSEYELLEKAFTHSSAVSNRALSNERLEFLGDSILGMVICRTLFERFPNYLEGDLTKIKSMLVSRRTCAKVVKQLDLQKFQKVGKGMSAGRALTGSIAAGLFEAIIAAIYFDSGFEAAQRFIMRSFAPLIQQANAQQSQGNFKSLLQQYAQQNLNATPVYELLDEKGPDHNKCFEAAVIVAGRQFQSAWGVNKKEAEQKAAFNALVALGLIKDTAENRNF
ncbi:MAG: ribonuclease III [Planctomycetota bacterium]|jgi:ribonuclease-3